MAQVGRAVTFTHVMWVCGWHYAQETSVKDNGLGQSCKGEMRGSDEDHLKTKHAHTNEAVKKQAVTKVWRFGGFLLLFVLFCLNMKFEIS